MKKAIWIVLTLILFSQFVFAQAITVTNLNNTGLGSLRYAIDSASTGDTVVFDNNLLTGHNDTIFLNSSILIDDEIYLKGLNHDTAKIYLSGSDTTRIFRVNIQSPTHKNLKMQDMFFIDAKGSSYFGNGGAILLQLVDTLRIINCEFKDCHATNNGGAIYANASGSNSMPKYMQISGTKFTHNSANSMFSNKTGNIYLDQTGPIHITNCIFSELEQRGNYFKWSDGIFMENTTIRNNGFASKTTDARVFVTTQIDTIYMNNILAHNNHTSWKGTVFYLGSGGTLIENSLFYNNHSSDEGGVFYSTSMLNFKNCQFLNNSASWGGALGVRKSNFEQCLFKGNSASSIGGVLFTTNTSGLNKFHFYACELDSNSCAGDGGAIAVRKADFVFENSSATNNTSGGNGGAFEILQLSNILIKNSTISNNACVAKGGALALDNVVPRIKGSTIVNNSAGIGGDFMFAGWTDSLLLEGSIILNNGTMPFMYYSTQSPIQIRSNGFNILQFNGSNLLPNDIANLDSNFSVLGPLQYNGGTGKTHLPISGSIAVNRGNPQDTSMPQNDSIYAYRRDVGAAESQDSSVVFASSTSICDSIFLGGQWYDQIAFVTDTSLSQYGTDSITCFWINEVNTTIKDTQVVKSCEPFLWLDGNIYTANSDSTQLTFISTKGCDSVVTLDFTRLNISYLDTQEVTSCKPFMWIDSVNYVSSSDTSFVVLNSKHNCDSTVYLDFTRITIDNTVSQNGATFTANESNAIYQWLDCNNNFSILAGGTKQSYTAITNGSYAVVIIKNGCRDTSDCIELNNIGINDFSKSEFNIYPNPTSAILHVELSNELVPDLLQVTDMTGRLLKSVAKSSTINVENFPNGIYVLSIKTDQTVMRKVFEKTSME